MEANERGQQKCLSGELEGMIVLRSSEQVAKGSIDRTDAASQFYNLHTVLNVTDGEHHPCFLPCVPIIRVEPMLACRNGGLGEGP